MHPVSKLGVIFLTASAIIAAALVSSAASVKEKAPAPPQVSGGAKSHGEGDAAAPGEPNTLSPVEYQAGFRLLFDGRTMDHFRAYNGQKISDAWQVQDGAIVLTHGGGGDIITREQYGAFELLIDYRISKGGNSGVMFHIQEGAEQPGMTGPEIQVQDNVAGTDPQKAGWLYQLYPATNDPKTGKPLDTTRPAGEWNTLRIVISKAPAKSAIYMNGVKYSEFVIGSEDWKQRVAKSKFNEMKAFHPKLEGFIDLQDHGNEVAYRNIKIREIGK
jgi:hypothetical protein